LFLVLLWLKLLLRSWKKYKSPGSGQIPAELVQAGGEILRSEIRKLGISVWSKDEVSDQWKGSIIVPVYKKEDKIDCSNYRRNHCYEINIKFY
jgi:hypothetical protein